MQHEFAIKTVQNYKKSVKTTDTDTDTLLKFKQQTCMNRQLTLLTLQRH